MLVSGDVDPREATYSSEGGEDEVGVEGVVVDFARFESF